MKVKDLIRTLEQCNPEYDVYFLEDIGSVESEICQAAEITVSSQGMEGVYLFSAD